MSIRFYTPEKVTVCARLAGDHQAGVLLYVIVRRYQYAKATLPGIEGRWSANLRKEWFKAAGLSDSQGDRALKKLAKRGLIEREHGAWGRNPNVLYVRPTEHTFAVLNIATTFLALDAVLGGESTPLHQLGQLWPDTEPKKQGVIAEWYELLGGMTGPNQTKADFRPYAQKLLKLILKREPKIADIDPEDLGDALNQGTTLYYEEVLSKGIVPT
jgi:hypothetical protein